MKNLNQFIIALLFFLSAMSYANPTGIRFANSCVPGEQLTIAAVGDILLHKPLQIKGSKEGFDSIWKTAEAYIQQADIAYANLEGPIAEGVSQNGKQVRFAANKNFQSTYIYSGFPLFNYPPGLASAIKKSGFDVVSTANNHALDRYPLGIDKTIVALDRAGISHAGTKKQDAATFQIPITQQKGFKIAWIACAENTNGNTDKQHQVLHCYQQKDRAWIISSIRSIKDKVDAIIVTPHWGEEYESRPNSSQINFAHEVLEAGALAVFGSHPHVLQRMEKYQTQDGRDTFIVYSLGNFVSYQGSTKSRVTIILLLGLTKTSHKTIINGVKIVPLYMENRSGLQNIHLTKIPGHHTQAHDALQQVMHQENVLNTEALITNPECR